MTDRIQHIIDGMAVLAKEDIRLMTLQAKADLGLVDKPHTYTINIKPGEKLTNRQWWDRFYREIEELGCTISDPDDKPITSRSVIRLQDNPPELSDAERSLVICAVGFAVSAITALAWSIIS